MTQDPNVIVAVDVGTTKVCSIVARREGTRHFRVVSYSVVPSRGLEKGIVTDISEAQSAIRSSIAEAARQAAATVTKAYVGITGAHVNFENRNDSIDWAAAKGVITRADLDKVPQKVASNSVRPGREVIHALPRNYTLDGQSGIVDPLGMHTDHMEVDSHVVSAESSIVRRLAQAVGRSGVSLEALVLEPLASAEAVLSEDEKFEGSVLVDIGGGTSDIIIFDRGVVEYTSVLPVGGYQFTNDICVAFNTTYDAAEAAKLEYGTTEPTSYGALDDVTLPSTRHRPDRSVSLRDLALLMRERATELVRLIRIKMTESGITNTTKTSLVLTGGSSILPGFDGIARRYITPNVRIAGASVTSDLPEELRGPEYSTSVGLVIWALNNEDGPSDSGVLGARQTADNSHGSGPSRLFKWMFPR